MSEVLVRFPKPIAYVFAIVGIPFLVSLTFAFALMTFSLHAIAQQFPVWKIAIAYVLFPFMTVLSAKSTITLIRYGTETLFTTFRLSDGGIIIENKRYGMLMLAWRDVEAASYNRSLKTLVLKSHHLAKPIAIMNNASSESAAQHGAQGELAGSGEVLVLSRGGQPLSSTVSAPPASACSCRLPFKLRIGAA